MHIRSGARFGPRFSFLPCGMFPTPLSATVLQYYSTVVNIPLHPRFLSHPPPPCSTALPAPPDRCTQRKAYCPVLVRMKESSLSSSLTPFLLSFSLDTLLWLSLLISASVTSFPSYTGSVEFWVVFARVYERLNSG